MPRKKKSVASGLNALAKMKAPKSKPAPDILALAPPAAKKVAPSIGMPAGPMDLQPRRPMMKKVRKLAKGI